MTALRDLAQGDAEIQKILDDAAIGHRTAARMINLYQGGEPVTSEKSVRRYRSRARSAETLANPQPPAAKAAVRGSGGNWHPGIDIDPAEGGEFRTVPVEVTQGVTAPEPEEAELLAKFDLDPAVWEVTGARKSLWQSGDRWLEAHRVSFRRRSLGTVLTVGDIDGIMAQYATRAARPRVAEASPGRLVMIPAGDLQLGKNTAHTVDQFCRVIDEIAAGLQRYIDQPVPPGQALILPWLGDCIEGIVSQKGRLLTSLDIPVTEQVRVYRRLMMHQVGVLAPLATKILVPVVPGNHDETTRVQEMPVTDSWAIEGASAVADWCQGRPGYEHVEFVFPDPGELGVTVDVGTAENPYVVSFHHGHMATAPAGIIPWWKGQAYGRQHAGAADMLVSAHFHQLRVEHTGGGRTWLQIPALDGGSPWYRRKTGEDAPTGLVSVELTPGADQGWRGLTVHS